MRTFFRRPGSSVDLDLDLYIPKAAVLELKSSGAFQVLSYFTERQ